jgi:hypothetical protein
MSELMNIRNLVQRGAPANGDEARRIIRVALENGADRTDDWERRLSAALTEILVGRQLHLATYAARASALVVIDETDRRRVHQRTRRNAWQFSDANRQLKRRGDPVWSHAAL